MAARRILQLGDPVLRQCSASVPEPRDVSGLLDDLSDTLTEFRHAHGFGRGISAIQIGDARRVIFLRVEGRPYELVNPQFIEMSEETFELWDDCFSFPNLMVRLRRHASVRVRYQDRSGSWAELAARDALSELVQHEMDHLDGILAVDRAASSRDLATREEFLRLRSATRINFDLASAADSG
jgi:peptide deformylase